MGDATKFASVLDYNIFNGAFLLLLLAELVILIATTKGSRNSKKKSADNGTVIWVLLAFFGSILLAVVFRSRRFGFMAGWLLPYAFYYIGIALIVLGVAIRCSAVIALRRAFTLTVQTSDSQRLMRTGLYGIVRNPAYLGSILSLLGVAFAYRHIVGTAGVLVLCFGCYGIRISEEEKALEKQFAKEFRGYCAQTKYRLFPGIY